MGRVQETLVVKGGLTRFESTGPNGPRGLVMLKPARIEGWSGLPAIWEGDELTIDTLEQLIKEGRNGEELEVLVATEIRQFDIPRKLVKIPRDE